MLQINNDLVSKSNDIRGKTVTLMQKQWLLFTTTKASFSYVANLFQFWCGLCHGLSISHSNPV